MKISEKGCEISIDFQDGDLKEPQPLILTNSYKVFYPDENGILTFSSGQLILLACPDKNNGFNAPFNSQHIIKASCVQSKQFKVNGKSYSFHSFTCKKSQKSVVKREGTCLNKFSQVDVGFRVLDNFVSIYEICRDDDTDETYYVKEEMTASVGGHQSKNPRPTWSSHNLFQGKVDSFYKQKHQKSILKQILKSDELVQKYFKKAQLQRGHLAARSDFVYGIQQNATFSYANAAPQWSSFNTGNWKYIENAVRQFVQVNDLEVTIYTGVHGQMMLKDINNNKQPLFLDIDENNNNYIRVPKFFWKIVYDPIKNLALTLIGVNDPFSEKVTKDMFLCKDIAKSSKFDWLTKSWRKRTQISLGFSYICDYNEIKKVVHTLPKLKVKGSLESSVNISLDDIEDNNDSDDEND